MTVSATDDYKDRVSMSANFSLLLSSAKLSDQHTFTCMQADGSDIQEFSINVVVYSELILDSFFFLFRKHKYPGTFPLCSERITAHIKPSHETFFFFVCVHRRGTHGGEHH